MLALDMDSLAKTTPIVQAMAQYVGYFKVGLELMSAAGAPQAVQHVRRLGGRIFLDGKFSDIPNTMAGAVKAAESLGVEFLTVHASSGPDSLRAASDSRKNTKILGVTVLTSLDDVSCEGVFGSSIQHKVLQFARDAIRAGLDGIVCSGLELEWLRQEADLKPLLKVVPGVRPEWAQTQDQKRSVTPPEAIQLGADYIVIGRPILQPPLGVGSPLDAAKLIAESIRNLRPTTSSDAFK